MPAPEAPPPNRPPRRPANPLREQPLLRILLIAAAGVILVLIMLNLNSRLQEYARLSTQRDILRTQVIELKATSQVLETQLAYSGSDQAVQDYARDNHMIQPGDVLIVPLTPVGQTVSTPQPTAQAPSISQNWEVWWALFFQ